MAQGEFTKQEAAETVKAVEELYGALTKSKRMDYLGHLNDILLFIEAAKKNAPEQNNPAQRVSEKLIREERDERPKSIAKHESRKRGSGH